MMIRIPLLSTQRLSKHTRLLLVTMLLTLLNACASTDVQHSYDFGSSEVHSRIAQTNDNQQTSLKFSLAEIQAPINLESAAMLYRLMYDNPQALRPYANSRWSMPPSQLLKQRIIARINQAGGAVTASTDGIASLPLLKIDLDEFAQHFSTPQSSQIQLRWRASLIHNKQLLAQKVFSAQINSNSADAMGGARAMPIASDQTITELITWLQTQLK